jgi:muconate cycloisomerase
VPVLWTLASGDPAQEIEEAEAKLAARLHRTFKVKIGAQPAEADLARLRRLAAALGDRAALIVDANQAWDETTAVRCLPELAEFGIRLVEQPLPAWDIAGMARLRARSTVPLMADECVFSAHDMLAVATAAAADVVSLKLVKHGGLLNTRKVAAVAEAAGIGLYGGCLLESSIGAAAHLQVFATLRDLAWGCEHFGPQILTDDLVTEPLRFEEFDLLLPDGPGIGVTLDRDKLRRYARA